jgi:hypothetical protein
VSLAIEKGRPAAEVSTNQPPEAFAFACTRAMVSANVSKLRLIIDAPIDVGATH